MIRLAINICNNCETCKKKDILSQSYNFKDCRASANLNNIIQILLSIYI